MIINADLHIHSHYSNSTSPKMNIETISLEAPYKGIDVVGTGDCLHSGWIKEIKNCNIIDEGTFELNNTRFILSTEVETDDRMHHLIYFPSLSKVDDFKKITKHFSKNLETGGRPKINITGEELASIAKEVEALIGPAHAFNPWTGLYSNYNSIKECYGNLEDYISFIELGLSADSIYADRIKELSRLTFLTNSDSHSSHPVRFAREFNRFEVEEKTFDQIKKTILRKNGNKSVSNIGLYPEEGKYNESACISCFKHYTLEGAKENNWRCICGNKIKKGVKDKISERADYLLPIHPNHRPPYIHIIPLYEIITKAVGLRNPFTLTASKIWTELIRKFGNEINILLDIDLEDIAKITVPSITEAIKAFRECKVIINPGGGGKYGTIDFPWEEKMFTISLS